VEVLIVAPVEVMGAPPGVAVFASAEVDPALEVLVDSDVVIGTTSCIQPRRLIRGMGRPSAHT
jgi:hypothetical protein